MPRITYRDRLQAIIDNSAIPVRERTFAESLLSSYNRKGKLTPGRARCVRDLEARWSAEAIAAREDKDTGMLARIAKIKDRPEVGSWPADFARSIYDQVEGGRVLTESQLTQLAKIEGEYSDEAMAVIKTWKEQYKINPILRQNALRAARYYETTGYFGKLARCVLEESTFVPNLREYNKLVENKYAQKVIAAYETPPKFAAGEMVSGGAGINNARGVRGLYNKAMVILQNDGLPVVSAAKGTRCYKVLPVGSATTHVIEERWLKANRRARKLAKSTAQ